MVDFFDKYLLEAGKPRVASAPGVRVSSARPGRIPLGLPVSCARPAVRPPFVSGRSAVGSVIKKRRKRMAKKKHRKLLKKTRIQRRRQGK